MQKINTNRPARRRCLQQRCLVALVTLPLWALAGAASAASHERFDDSGGPSELEDAILDDGAEEGQLAILLHAPQGHAWGSMARSPVADAHRAPQSFRELATPVEKPAAAPAVTSPVPEMASYALTMAGLAAIGVFVTRRRRRPD